jgi:pimeloyl-ACP methyl ester carboxylesterase
VLNDEPRPEDLPEPQPSPYAALPPELAGHATNAGERPGPDGMMGGTLRKVVAAIAVIALLAATLLAVWGLFRAAEPVAGDAWSQTGSAASVTPTPGVPGRASATTPGATGAPGPTSATGPADTDYPAALAAFYTQRVDWKSCGDASDHQCATIEVPVDYAKPGGDRFTLALRKAPATDPGKRLGSLLINPGGPGGSGVQYAQLSSFAFTPELRAAYDIVGFDPRGIGQSSPVRCLSNADMDRLFSVDPTPDTPAERSTLLSESDRITAECAQRGGERARHLSTTEVARDMDVMRVLLGDRKLNFFGGSYGTFLGAIYADTFPKKVGQMVLDSAMSPNQTDEQEMTYDIQGFESSIDAFIDWCVPRSDCALGSDKAAARGKIAGLLDAVEKRGLRTSKPGLQRIGEGWVGFSIFLCLYSSQLWPTLNKGLAQAFTGTGDILLAKGMSVVERSASGRYADSTYLQAMLPVRCADWPRSSLTPALAAAQAKAKAAHPLWARMTGELYDNCRAWPTKGRTPKGSTLAVGAAPILVIGNERDPATPIGGTKQLAKDLASGVLLTSDHDGHGTYFAGSNCVDSAVDAYLLKGTVPANGKAC